MRGLKRGRKGEEERGRERERGREKEGGSAHDEADSVGK